MGGGAAVESEPAGDFAGWVRQVNADVAAVERAADEAEQAAAGTGGWFTRSSGCLNAEGRVAQAIKPRAGAHVHGDPPAAVHPGRGWQPGLAGARRAHRRGPGPGARAACESIGPPPPAR